MSIAENKTRYEGSGMQQLMESQPDHWSCHAEWSGVCSECNGEGNAEGNHKPKAEGNGEQLGKGPTGVTQKQ